ncbi:DUF1684 domain-containing protein [Corynebacterium crudilactis]|uniref:DUF1684 domain-containing protein n=1 Tax=Corynebacterium crudilactis TaxID=1652495 RepID=A0A172QX00_9CORY|nr:DUF1684 domain-containing protein [Corynebacterium crudilactis]ANE05158.1 hypothetical protein ccrud_13750 [Corynebacterium crudilactis]
MINTLHALPVNETEWHAWHFSRNKDAIARTGATSLSTTHWVSATSLKEAHTFPSLPGRWYHKGGGVVGAHLPPSFTTTGTVQLRPGELLVAEDFTLTVIERLGEFALQVFDARNPQRLEFQSIAAFPPSAKWRIEARFFPEPDTVNITAADGVIVAIPTAGWVHFLKNRVDYRLRVTVQSKNLRALFSDNSATLGVYPHRFVDIPRPDFEGNTIIDFNRSYLPPKALNQNFLCPAPSLNNHLNLTVEAGEKWVVAGN